jgi:hypothetical protein
MRGNWQKQKVSLMTPSEYFLTIDWACTQRRAHGSQTAIFKPLSRFTNVTTPGAPLLIRRELVDVLPVAPCERGQQPARLDRRADRVVIDLDLDRPTLLLVIVGGRHCPASRSW